MQVISGTGDMEKLREEARHIYYAAPVLFPLLERRKNEAYGRLMSSFKQGKADNLTIIAELSVITDIERELKTKIQIYEAKEGNNATRTE